MPTIGPMELVILLTLALLIFGTGRLPELGRSMGTGIREFRQSLTGSDTPAAADARRRAVEGVKPTA